MSSCPYKISQSQEQPLMCQEGTVGAKFLAAKTADAALVVDDELLVTNLHGIGRAVLDAEAAGFAETHVRNRARGQRVLQRFFQEARQAEVHIRGFRRTEMCRP